MAVLGLGRRSDAGNRRWLVAGILLAFLAAEALVPRLLVGNRELLLFLGAGLVAIFVLPRPWLGLAVLLAYGPFAAAVRFGGASNLQSLLKDLFAVGLVVFWVLRMVLRREKWTPTVLDLPLALYALLLSVQVLRAPSLLRGVLALKILATYIPVYFLVTNNPPSRRQLERVLGLLFVVAAVTAVYGLYQYGTLGETKNIQVAIEGQAMFVSLREGRLRVFSTFAHSIVFSTYLGTMITLGLALLPAVRGRYRLLLMSFLALAAWVLPLTLSRMGWVGVGIGLAVLLLLASHGRYRVLLLVAAVLGASVFFAAATPEARETLSWSFTSQDQSFVERSDLLYWAYRMTFVEMPLGCGLGILPDSGDLASRITGRPQVAYPCRWNGAGVNGADTVALAVGVQAGAAGYLLFLLIHAILLVTGIRSYLRLRDPFLKALAAGLVGWFAIMGFGNFFAGAAAAFPIVDLYFWAFAGILMSLERMEALSGARGQGAGGRAERDIVPVGEGRP